MGCCFGRPQIVEITTPGNAVQPHLTVSGDVATFADKNATIPSGTQYLETTVDEESLAVLSTKLKRDVEAAKRRPSLLILGPFVGTIAAKKGLSASAACFETATIEDDSSSTSDTTNWDSTTPVSLSPKSPISFWTGAHDFSDSVPNDGDSSVRTALLLVPVDNHTHSNKRWIDNFLIHLLIEITEGLLPVDRAHSVKEKNWIED